MSNTKVSLPKNYKKLVAHKLSTSFKEATKIVTTPLQDLKPNEVLSVPAEAISIFPELNPEYIALLISGRTAVMGLDIVQYAKSLGCHVLGTCSSDEKVQLLKELKCDRPINYRKENLGEVLKKEYPNGVDIVWETIGGEMFKLCLKNLAVRGRLVLIGYITGYKSDEGVKPVDLKYLPKELLWTSRTIAAFALPRYHEEYPKYHAKLLEMHKSKQFKLFTDFGDQTPGGKFIGLESVARAVEYLHSGTTTGKIIITMPD